MEQIKKRNLFHKVPKSLAIAVANKVDGATSAILLVFALINDRFNVKVDAIKQCFDSNETIQKRTGLSKVTVEKSISWLLRWKFLEAEYVVSWSDFNGHRERFFDSNKDGMAFVIWFRSTGGICKGPKRIIKPPEEMPTIDELGLEIKDRKHGIFSKIEDNNYKKNVDINYPDDGNKLSTQPQKNLKLLKKTMVLN